MPAYFIGFLVMLGAAVLLFLAALVAAAVSRRSPPAVFKGSAASTLQALHLALVWSSVGVGWLLYFNVYRIHVDMAAVSNAAFQAFTRGYTSRLPIVVLPFGAGALVASLCLWARPAVSRGIAPWAIAALWMLSLLSTPWAAGAQGDMQEQGFTEAAFQQLQIAHLVRTVCVSVAAVWALIENQSTRAQPGLKGTNGDH